MHHNTFCRLEERDLSKWLILRGALCKDNGLGDLDVEVMKKDLGQVYDKSIAKQERKLLLEWASDLYRARTLFLLFLSGAFYCPKHANRTRQSSSPLQLICGKSGVLELIGDYAGFVRGREARIVRQLTEMLPAINQELHVDEES